MCSCTVCGRLARRRWGWGMLVRGLGGREHEQGAGFDYQVFENRVREWGIEEKQGMSRYDYV